MNKIKAHITVQDLQFICLTGQSAWLALTTLCYSFQNEQDSSTQTHCWIVLLCWRFKWTNSL